MNIWIIMLIVMGLSLIIQQMLQSRFNKYSKVPLSNGMSGAEVALKMLHDNGIYDVKVVATRGMLTDNYNPQTKTVSLSEGVYASRSVAAQQLRHMNADMRYSMRPAMLPGNAFCTGSRRVLLFKHRTMGTSGRSNSDKRVPFTAVDRNRPVRHDYAIQPHNTSC